MASCGSVQLHAAPCISRLYLKDMYAAPVVLEVYTMAPCISRLYLKDLYAGPVVFEVYTMAPCGSMHL